MQQTSRDDKRADLQRWHERFGKGRKASDIQHILQLDRDYPDVDMFGPQSIGVHCGQGWAALLREAVQAINEAGGRIGQIKQKFGGLRIYWDPSERLRKRRLEWIDAGKQGPDPFTDPLYTHASEVVRRVQEASFGVCEHCGISIVPPRSESFQTLCDRCSK